MSHGRHLFTSESVSKGHPDKVADQISDAVLDALIEKDAQSRVACEVLVTTGLVLMTGEITTRANVDYAEIARQTLREIGYTDADVGMDADSCAVLIALGRQSPDIAMGVNPSDEERKEQGAGDQGMMYGFACKETRELMPVPIMLAHRIMERLAEVRASGALPYLRPDGKTQVTVEYEGQRPVRVDTVVLSAQHNPDVKGKRLEQDLVETVIKPCIPHQYDRGDTKFHINPTGRFVIGGPLGDAGLTGRKIIVDTYGGRARHGGGAFSGKDPSKVDRSASYAVRYAAKNIVAAGLADICEVQISYAIGESDPISVNLTTEGTAKVPEDRIRELIIENFDLTPRGIIESLDLLRPIYRKTAAFGHFGRAEPEFTWERTDKADMLRRKAGL